MLLYINYIFFILCFKNIGNKIKINRDEININSLITDDDYLYYFYQLYLSPAPIEEFLPIVKNYFISKNNSTMIKIFSNFENYTIFFYSSLLDIYDNKQFPSIKQDLFKNYTLFFLNKTNFFINIKLNPCTKYIQYCCEGLGQCLEDNYNITAKKDLEIVYIFNNFLPNCGNEYRNRCGTFLEIHMPANPLILQEKQINEIFSSGYKTIFLSTKSLCSGRYELWIVIRMRDFNYIVYVKPFNVLSPSCNFKEVANHGYVCQ